MLAHPMHLPLQQRQMRVAMTGSAREQNDHDFMLQLEALITLVSEARELLGQIYLRDGDGELTTARPTARPH
jgi:hypothetical protein